MEQIGGRKFIYILLITIMSFSLVAIRLATPKEWFEFILGAALLFFGGNLGEHFISSKQQPPINP